eukprot:Gb_34173 [translate_table: standard]
MEILLLKLLTNKKLLNCGDARWKCIYGHYESFIEREDDCFMMHDHLRDLGRQIVAEERPELPGKCSRLHNPDDVNQAIKQKELFPTFTHFADCAHGMSFVCKQDSILAYAVVGTWQVELLANLL